MKNSKISKMSALSLAVLSALSMSVYAADVSQGGDTQVKTKDVVVTATKTEAEVKAVPQAVEVIDSEDIQRMGANDVLTALSLANNLNLSKAGMTGNAVSLRGMSTNHTLILIDGRRQAAEDTDVTTNVYALERMNVSDIDRIEIVRGPSSALYGSDAMGGVINIITKTPEKAGGTIGAVTGTENTGAYFNFNFGKHGRWTTSVDGRIDKQRAINRYTYTGKANSITDGYNRSMYGIRNNFHFNAIYDFENTNQNKLRFDIDYMKENLRSDFANTLSRIYTGNGYLMSMGPSMPQAPREWILTNNNKREWYHNEQKGFSVEYTGKTQKNEYQFRSYYNQLEKYSNLVNDRVLPADKVTVIIPPAMRPMVGMDQMEFNYANMYPATDYDYAKYNTWLTEARNTMYIGDNHNLTFGGEYRRLEYEGTRLGEPTESITQKNVASKNVNSYAGYVEDMWQVNDKLLLIPSVRLEHNSQFGSEATPKIGATYNINNNVRFKANYGKGYKAPSISELYMKMHRAMGVATVNVYGNPDLQPEETKSFDFGIEFDKGKNFGKLTYFNNDVTNLITTEELPTDDDTISSNRYINIGKAQINGIEAEFGHRFNDRLTFKVNHNWLDATNESSNFTADEIKAGRHKGERLNNRAKNTTTFQLIYDDHKPTGISAVLWDEFASDYQYNYENYTYNTVNFSINKKWSPEFSTYAGIDNIFDKVVDDLYIDGRLWRVGAEWKF